MIYLRAIRDVYEQMQSLKSDLSEEMLSLPEGRICFNTAGNGKRYYYERLAKKGNRKKERRISVSNDPERLGGLVRKDYIEKALPRIEEDLNRIGKLIEGYHAVDELSLMSAFIRDNPDLEKYVYRPGNSFDDWSSNYEKADGLYEDNLKATSAEGTKMRSMGEIAIASRLNHFNIPYRYEAVIGIPEMPYVPDFTIRRPGDGQIFYWEHLGMVSDEEYMKRNSVKFDRYAEYGIVPWRNLIVTYGTEDGGIDIKIVDAMIHGWLL